MRPHLRIFWLLALSALPVAANDVVYLRGEVRMQDGSPPGHSVVIVLECPGADPVRETNAGRNGKFNLKVERDDFNHVARALPTTTLDVGDPALAGSCWLAAQLEGYDSSHIDLATFTIGQDLKLPPLVLRPKTPLAGRATRKP
jgi:hypothetical protein